METQVVEGNLKGVYAVVNAVQERVYIGSTADSIQTRWRSHISLLRGGRHYNPHMQKDFDEDGEDAFSLRVLESYREIVDRNRLIGREQHWLTTLSNTMSVYNVVRKVYRNGAWGWKHSEEARGKISKALRDRRLSKVHVQRMVASKVKSYPPLLNIYSGDRIPAGKNLRALARELGVDFAQVQRLIAGSNYHVKGWIRADLPIPERIVRMWYPPLRNVQTGKVIPGGYNLCRMCRQRGLDSQGIWRMTSGAQKSFRGWMLADENVEQSA